jgi:hypothetical protein
VEIDIETLEVKMSKTSDVLAECPEDFETTTVWATLALMKSDVSRMESGLSCSRGH